MQPSDMLNPPPGHTWEEYMRAALSLSRRAWILGEIPVGALVVDGTGTIIGDGINTPIRDNDPTAHAEIQALRAAAQTVGNYRLTGSILVVTLEPCLMCVGAIVHARLAGVVYGAHDPKTGALCSCIRGTELPFQNHRPLILGGILEEECAQLLRSFFRQRREEKKSLRAQPVSDP